MVLEATMICIDNSESMRNGDYPPSRFEAQAEAINLICSAKLESNPENTVGLLTMAGNGKGASVLITPTNDLADVLARMHAVEIGGEINLAVGLEVAQLPLKHRQNRYQRQRIVVFAGSSVHDRTEELEMIGKKLKKNGVALDVISFGEEDEGKNEKLSALVAAADHNDNSHFVLVPLGGYYPGALSEVLASSPILVGGGGDDWEGGSGFAAAPSSSAYSSGGGLGGLEFDVDPNLDPELALALRVSMEEERARQEAAAKQEAGRGGE
ncbi:OLC1v1036887C1 [Oldenlandia corymbosa var. corymbosa]|uniref:26S proteasome non-ATPase regulatory subunit 4 homolog n=1 Tax=Oldenlandia corymbosa var. corymbosa TaxID=529605 RepID=A0AAV1CXJ6_OLDCO|nr:OLC1v1036887C1 [Oldenlandia corymbosa var. corymbosa]